MGLTSRRRTRIVLAVLAVTGAAAMVDLSAAWKARRIDAEARAVAAGARPTRAATEALELRFAAAYAEAASGATDAALNHYRALQADTPLGQAARYNAASLLLRQAVEVRAGNEPGQAIALIELAKETLRDVLRNDPEHWAARSNLERAQRLLADPDESDADPPDAARNRERAATTMRGFSPGLP